MIYLLSILGIILYSGIGLAVATWLMSALPEDEMEDVTGLGIIVTVIIWPVLVIAHIILSLTERKDSK